MFRPRHWLKPGRWVRELAGEARPCHRGGGVYGSHLVERLVQLGAHTRALVTMGSRDMGWLDHSPCRKEIEVYAGDLVDRDCVFRAVKDREVVFHLGALIAIPYSYEAPLSYLRTNVEGTLNVLQAVRQWGVERVIHTSTSEVYGTAKQVSIDQDHPLQGQSPYAATKSPPIKWPKHFTFHSAFRSSPSVHSIRMVLVNRLGRSSRPSLLSA